MPFPIGLVQLVLSIWLEGLLTSIYSMRNVQRRSHRHKTHGAKAGRLDTVAAVIYLVINNLGTRSHREAEDQGLDRLE